MRREMLPVWALCVAAAIGVGGHACYPANSPQASRTEDRVLVTTSAELVGLEKNVCIALVGARMDAGYADGGDGGLTVAQALAGSCVADLQPASRAILYAAQELDIAAVDQHSAAICAAFRTSTATTGMLNIAKLYGVAIPVAVTDLSSFVVTALNVASEVPCLAFDGGI